MANIKPIINVQFMRAMAALAVLAYHFSFQFQNAGGASSNWFFYLFNQIGYAGVDFFFVISGYIMWITTQKTKQNNQALVFAYKRATRIYLGYWPYFLLALLLINLYPSLASSQINQTGSFFLSELNMSKLLIQVAWTLQYELYFYAIFTLLLLFKRSHALKAITLMIALIVAFQWLKDQLPTANLNIWLNFLLSPYCLEFFAGCLMGAFFQNHRLKWVPALALAGLGLLLLAIYIQEKIINGSLISGHHINLRVLVYGTAAWILLAVLIELEMRGRILLQRFSVLVGGASYSIYLSHTLVIALVYITGLQLWIKQNSQWPGIWLLVIMLLTVLYSIIHYLWIEKPLMQWAKVLQGKLFKRTA